MDFPYQSASYWTHMSNTDLLAYIGVISGLIGAVTGISGSLMGYFSYRRTGEIKSLELRLELMKTGVEAFQSADDLGVLLDRAERSRNAVAAAMGTYNSGAREGWMRQLAADQESLASINESVDELNVDYSKSSLSELEAAAGDLHVLRATVKGISERYVASIVEDDRNREFLRDQSHARANL